MATPAVQVCVQEGRGVIDRLSTWETVERVFQKAGFGSEEAKVQGQMARILRAQDYDFKNRKPLRQY